jgi:hypothetical protein
MSLNLHVLVLGHKGVVLGQEVARFHAQMCRIQQCMGMMGHTHVYTLSHIMVLAVHVSYELVFC